MNGLPYYKAYPRDFVEGTVGMRFELKGAYRLVLDLIYMQGGRLPDDSRYISGLLGCSVKKWNGFRIELLEMGKISINGKSLTNLRAITELEILAKYQDKQAENASKSRKNKGLDQPEPSHTEPDTEEEPERKNKIDSSLRSLGEAVGNDELDLAFGDWNTLAGHVGLPKAASFTPKRKAALRQRLKDCGGRKGWQDALRLIPHSPFLMGENGSGFTATLDFVLQSSSFTKLVEGNYAKRGNGPATKLKGLALIEEQLRQEISNDGFGGPESSDNQAIQRLAFSGR